MPKEVRYSNHKCYLRHLQDCSTTLTGEHIVSANLLRRMSVDGRTVKISGFWWQVVGVQNKIGLSGLVANCLCDKHNSRLSPLDTAAGHFFGWLYQLGSVESPLPGSKVVDGRLVERWMLKSMLASIESNKSGRAPTVPLKLLNLVASPLARWPTGWGLYVSQNKDAGVIDPINGPTNSFSMGSKFDPVTNNLTAVEVNVGSATLTLVLAKPPAHSAFGHKRPNKIEFSGPEGSSQVKLLWGDMKAGPTITFNHSEYVYPGNIRSAIRLTVEQRKSA